MLVYVNYLPEIYVRTLILFMSTLTCYNYAELRARLARVRPDCQETVLSSFSDAAVTLESAQDYQNRYGSLKLNGGSLCLKFEIFRLYIYTVP